MNRMMMVMMLNNTCSVIVRGTVVVNNQVVCTVSTSWSSDWWLQPNIIRRRRRWRGNEGELTKWWRWSKWRCPGSKLERGANMCDEQLPPIFSIGCANVWNVWPPSLKCFAQFCKYLTEISTSLDFAGTVSNSWKQFINSKHFTNKTFLLYSNWWTGLICKNQAEAGRSWTSSLADLLERPSCIFMKNAQNLFCHHSHAFLWSSFAALVCCSLMLVINLAFEIKMIDIYIIHINNSKIIWLDYWKICQWTLCVLLLDSSAPPTRDKKVIQHVQDTMMRR